MSDITHPAPRPSVMAALPGAGLRVGVIATLVLLLIGFASLVWTPHPVDGADVTAQLLDPSLTHVLGTDAQGRDVLSLVMKGMLTSYVVAGIGVALGGLVGAPLGLVAAWRGGSIGWSVERFSDFLGVVPALATAALIGALAGPGVVNVMVAIGLATMPLFARTTKAAAELLLQRDYVAAGRLAGLGEWDAAGRHVFPDLMPMVIGQTLMLFGFAVIAEAALSFVGLGAVADGISLGLMLREAQGSIAFEPLLMLAPGLAVALIAVSLQLAGDGLRRTADERLGMAERDDALA